MEQQTPIPPQIKDEAARRAKTCHFPILDLGGRGGLGFPFILSKIAGANKSEYITEGYALRKSLKGLKYEK